MKVSTTDVPPRQVALDIEVEQPRVDRAADQAYRRLAQRVNIPGFRRGKAPRPIVERYVGRDRILEDALDHLLPEVVDEAIRQEGIDLFGRARVENVEFEPLRLRAVVPLRPRVELGNYRTDLHVPHEPVTVTPEQIDELVERLRESHAQWVPVERPVAAKDRVGLDVRGTVVGTDRVILDAKDAEYVVDPDGAQPAPGFADALVGLAGGEEREVTLTLPEDYREADLAGKEVQFQITLHWVKERQLPDLDDAFAQMVGDFENVDAVRAGVEEQIRTRESERVKEKVQNDALDGLAALSVVEYPPQLADQQAQMMLESIQRGVEAQGLRLSQYLQLTGKDEEAFRAELRQDAETRIRRSLALESFADAEQIEATPEEIEAEMRAANDTSPDGRERAERVLRERMALDRLVEIATASPPESAGAPTEAAEAEKISGTEGASADTEPQKAAAEGSAEDEGEHAS